jgi:hypothetical protein
VGEGNIYIKNLALVQLLSDEILLFDPAVAIQFSSKCNMSETGLSAVSESNARNFNGFRQRRGEILGTCLQEG